MRAAIAVFICFFGVYLAALPPSLAPYRDAGEMAASAFTLGVSHPTSYPLYILLARLAQAVPLGDPAYRLGILSALCAACACAAVFVHARRRWGLAAGLGSALLLGLNGTFWSVALVSEMYTLWLLGAAVLFACADGLFDRFEERRWLAFALLYGLCLANRLDILLWAPGLLWLALGSWKDAKAATWASLCFVAFPAALVLSDQNAVLLLLVLGTALTLYRGPALPRWALRTAAFAALGLGVYAFLPLRSARGPWLDWNHPVDPANFVESLLRSRYGGTLDLLSKNYAKGSLFGANMILYGRHLWRNFSAAGLALAAWGAFCGARRDGRRWLGSAACWWWSGPVFLLIANMPPNPHAAAIVEPHYLASDLILVFWAAEGVGALAKVPLRAAAVAALVLVPLLGGRWAESSRRDHLFTYDYAKSVLRSVPPGGALAAKKDVQLYTLWYYQTARGWRPDARVVAQGLAGSPWYQAGWRRRDTSLFVAPIRNDAEWRTWGSAAAPAFATLDAEVPPGVSRRPWGLISALTPRPADASPDDRLAARRGAYSYETQPDFFTADIVDNHAGAQYAAAAAAFGRGQRVEAIEGMKRAWSMHWLYPEPALFLGYAAFEAKDYPAALRYYSLGAELADRLVALAQEFRVLPPVLEAFRRQSAEDLVQLGVVYEKAGEPERAKASYERSFTIFPLARAHYNYAVLFWNKDLAVAEREMQEALRLDPSNADTARYLEAAKRRRAR